jgi:hypothetical protein
MLGQSPLVEPPSSGAFGRPSPRPRLWVALAVLLWGCAGPQREINLWPLLQYSRDDARDYREVRVLGPLIRARREGDREERAITPLAHYLATDEESREVFFLWPLGRYLESPSDSDFRILPFILHRTRSIGEDHKKSFLLFPILYLAHSTRRGNSFAFFVLYGHVKDILGRDEIRWVLFPFWMTSRIGDRQAWSAPWPLVGGSTSEDGSSFRILPFYGYDRKDGEYRHDTFLWPIVHVQRNDLDTDDPTWMFFLFPLFGIEKGEHKERLVVLWPFFSYSKDGTTGVRFLSAPWPIFQVARTPLYERERYWPFYADYRSNELRSRFYLWPLAWRRDEKTRRYTKRTLTILPVWKQIDRTALPGGERSWGRQLWPLFASSGDSGGASELQILAIAPWREIRGFERIFSPLWTVYRRTGSSERGEAEAVWGAVRRRWSERGEVFSLPWVYHSFRSEDGSCDRSFLSGLFGISSGPDGGAFRLLTLPLLRW